MSGVRQRLADLYARLPMVRCKGLCQEACGPIGASVAEARIMERASGRPLTFDAETLTCGYLNAAGRCDVYAVRPFVCRIWGASAQLPCPWGCEPVTPVLTHDEERNVFLRVLDVGGGSVAARPSTEVVVK